MAAFAYTITPETNEYFIIIRTDLVLPMGWVDPAKFFCMLLETMTDVANALVHAMLPVPGYVAITKTPETGPDLPHTLGSLTHIYCYMDDAITAVQGGPEQQRQVFNGIARALNWLYLYLPGKTK